MPFTVPLARFIFLCFSTGRFFLTSAGTRIRVHCSEVQTMRSEAVYFPPEETHGWSHPMTNTGLYWSQCRQSPLTWSYRGEGFVFVCRHENVKKKEKEKVSICRSETVWKILAFSGFPVDSSLQAEDLFSLLHWLVFRWNRRKQKKKNWWMNMHRVCVNMCTFTALLPSHTNIQEKHALRDCVALEKKPMIKKKELTNSSIILTDRLLISPAASI